MTKPIDWQQILTDHRIEYVDRGPNVSRGELNIQCPFCGSADPSHHLGLNLDTGWWSCWRNQNHRGKSPIRLLMQLLRISYLRARELAGLGDDYIDPDGFDAVAARVMGRDQVVRMEEVRRDFISLPKEFESADRKLLSGAYTYRRHLKYLENRGFPIRDLPKLCAKYHIQAAHFGQYRDRIILPYYVNGELVTWTGRAIADANVRYLDLSVEDSLIPAKQTFYNHDCLITGGRTLLVVEGPFDVLKLDFYGERCGIRAVGLSTNSIREEQIYLLEDAVSQFDRVIIMLDAATNLGVVDSMRLKERLSHIPKIEIRAVPFGYKDGGEMPPRAVVNFAGELG